MDHAEAFRILRLDPGERDPGAIRSAYLTAIRSAHPDVSRDPKSGDRAAAIVEAYRVARLAEPPQVSKPSEPAPQPTATPSADPISEFLMVRVIGSDTIEVKAPLDETFEHLLSASHRAGDVIYLDRSAPILQVLVTFVGAPPSQIIFDLQGRAAYGTTEIFCSIESLDDRDPPPTQMVADFMADQLVQILSAAG